MFYLHQSYQMIHGILSKLANVSDNNLNMNQINLHYNLIAIF